MANPISDRGIITRTVNDAQGRMLFYSSRHRYKQKPPFNLILPYSSWYGQMTKFVVTGSPPSILGPDWNCNALPYGDTSPDFTAAANASYEKLKSKLYDTVGLGVDFAEYRQSVGMIASTATSLTKAALAIRRGHFGAAASHLRMKFAPKGVSTHKSFANNWLEFHFGWEPLIKDIQESCEVLNNPLKSFSFEKAVKKDVGTWDRVSDFGSGIQHGWAQKQYAVKQGARVKFIQNQLTHSLDQWGVINPAVIAWELVPFSFCVDWFANVGNFLSSLSDFAGMTLDSTFATYYQRHHVFGSYQTKVGFSPSYAKYWEHVYVMTTRLTTLSGVTFQVKKLKPPSVTRAATAISLLIQTGLHG